MNDQVEIWNDIPGFDAYEASSFGNIRNKKRNAIMAKYQTKLGYERITLRQDKKYVSVDVHRLVAMAFLQNPENKKTVNHKNRIKNDNTLNNLEWSTFSEQSLHLQTSPQPECMEQYKSTGVQYISHDDEQWVPLQENANYQISNYGFIKNMNTNYVKMNSADGRGYCYVSIDNKPRLCHRLVAKHFLSTFTDDCIVNHKDGNKSNNHSSNLECTTQSRNILHAYENKMINKSKQIAVLQVNEKAIVINSFTSLAEAESVTGINRGCIHNAITKNCPSHGYKWYRSYTEYENDKPNIEKDIFKVIQFDMSGNILFTFDSYKEAENVTGVKKVNINRAINREKNGIGAAGGYIWANNKTSKEVMEAYFHKRKFS